MNVCRSSRRLSVRVNLVVRLGNTDYATIAKLAFHNQIHLQSQQPETAMEQREGHLYERITLLPLQAIRVDSDQPIAIDFLTDNQYSLYPLHTGFVADSQMSAFPCFIPTLDSPVPGTWNAIVKHQHGPSPKVALAIVDLPTDFQPPSTNQPESSPDQ